MATPEAIGARVCVVSKESGHWDGTFDFEDRTALIEIGWHVEYPVLWFPFAGKDEGNGFDHYVRGSALYDAEEHLVYLIAHGLRHAWQDQHPRRRRLHGGIFGDEETDADVFALLKLTEWRFRKGKGGGAVRDAMTGSRARTVVLKRRRP